MSQVLRLREGQQPVEVSLSTAAGLALAASGAVAATPTTRNGVWTVGPVAKVGVLQVGEVEVWIAPKVDIRRLVFLLGYARRPGGWSDTPVPLDRDDDLLPALAQAFVQQAERALLPGLLHGYRTVEEALPVLRGRLRAGDQLTRRFGHAPPLEVVYDDFGVDIPENQLLLAAAARLLRLPGLHLQTRQALHRLVGVRLADVSALVLGQPLPIWRTTRLNARYHIALRLAEVVLAAESFDQRHGSLRVSGFLFDLARVFEDFVCGALREALVPRGGQVSLQHPTWLDVRERVRMKPDLVWLREGKPVAVVDAKYKAEKPSGFPDADLYQLLAYCTALDLPLGHVVYARGNENATSYVVRHARVRIVCHALDLDVDPAVLLDQVHELAHALTPGRVGRQS